MKWWWGRHKKAFIIIWITASTFDLSLIIELSKDERKETVLGEVQQSRSILEGRSYLWTILFIDRLNYS